MGTESELAHDQVHHRLDIIEDRNADFTMCSGLRELYMHKKKKRDVEPDSTTPKADIKSICKLGLRKHLDTLTHLMLKNDADDTWDLDQPTVRILSLRGSGLVELVVGMKMTTLVSSISLE